MTDPGPGAVVIDLQVVADGTVIHADGQECGGQSCTYPPHAALLAEGVGV